jgi:hypothetical protein
MVGMAKAAEAAKEPWRKVRRLAFLIFVMAASPIPVLVAVLDNPVLDGVHQYRILRIDRPAN